MPYYMENHKLTHKNNLKAELATDKNKNIKIVTVKQRKKVVQMPSPHLPI